MTQGSVCALPTTAPHRGRRIVADPPSGPAALSPREIEIIQVWIRLGANKLVAAELGVSEHTVRNHVTAILRKLDATAMGQAAVRYDRWARDRGHNRRSGFDRRQGERRQP